MELPPFPSHPSQLGEDLALPGGPALSQSRVWGRASGEASPLRPEDGAVLGLGGPLH